MRGKGACRGATLACALLALFLAGCAGGKEEVRGISAPPPATGPRVAIAPMENRSNDLGAMEIIRNAFGEQIARQGWNVVPAAESDRLLRESLGISYGGQLKATTPEEVCRALGVDGVFYGEVQEWNKTTTGIYNSVAVAAGFKLYGRDGTLAWEGSDRQLKQNVPRGGGAGIGSEIIGHAVANLLLNPMTPHGRSVGQAIARKLPGGALGPGRAESPEPPGQRAETPTGTGGNR